MTIIGIDLGTSNSAAAVLRGGRPVIIPSAEGLSIGGKAFHSYVALTADGQMLVGEPARRQATANPEGTVTAFKRKMGKRETIVLRGRDYSPEQLSAFLLQKIKRDAEAFLGEPVHKAVVTVAERFQMATGVDVRTDRKAAARLMVAAEAAKIDLTASVSVSVSLPYLAAAQGEPRHQSGQAQKGGPYAETRWEDPTPQPDVSVAGGEARPSGAGPRGKVVDAEYRENK